ncbi:MAG TPA: hypothetical protein VIC86_00560 [Acidimicrobiales bacterium]
MAVVAMLVAALAGAACVLHVHIVYGLVLALVVLAIIGVITGVLGRSGGSWAAS